MDASTGALNWRQLVARKANRQRFNRLEAEAPPLLCQHLGQIFLADNNGLIASLSQQGSIQEVWTYPRIIVPAPEFDMNLQLVQGERQPNMLSNGKDIVLTVQDRPGVVILSQGQLSYYFGPGAADRLVGLEGKQALLVGNSATLVDIDSGVPVWMHDDLGVSYNGNGILGDRQCWVVSQGSLFQFDRVSGALQHRMPAPSDEIFLIDHILLSSPTPSFDQRSRFISGMIDRQAGEQLQATLNQSPSITDRLTLAAIYRANNNIPAALDELMLGIQLSQNQGSSEGTVMRIVMKELCNNHQILTPLESVKSPRN